MTINNCVVCGEILKIQFICKFCNEPFCSKHRLPENHNCDGLKRWKESLSKDPSNWIYDAFKDFEPLKPLKGVFLESIPEEVEIKSIGVKTQSKKRIFLIKIIILFYVLVLFILAIKCG